MNQGDPINLFCHVKANQGSENWKTCTWTRVADGQSCFYELEKDWGNAWEVYEMCSPLLVADAEFWSADSNVGGDHLRNHFCGIRISLADQTDSSKWTCELNQCKNGCNSGSGNIAKATIDVQVIIST